MFSACSGPKNIFVLIPDAADGQVGEIRIRNQAGEQVITTPETAVSVRDEKTAPDKPKPIDSEGIKSIFRDALSAVPQSPAQFVLQFKTGTSSLTETSQKLLSKIIFTVIERQPCASQWHYRRAPMLSRAPPSCGCGPKPLCAVLVKWYP